MSVEPRRVLAHPWGACALVCLGACAPSDERDPVAASAAITGGTLNSGDPAVVVLYAEDNGRPSLCTASVIAPRALLTAAHCVSSQLHSAATRYFVYLGADFTAATPSEFRPVDSVHAHPGWRLDAIELGHDVAVVTTRDPLLVAPLPLRRVPLGVAELGQPLRHVGYGVVDGVAQAGWGYRREAQTALDDFGDLTLQYDDSTHLTCNGDSGGPALLRRAGVEELVGVTSYGDERCQQFGVDSRVDAELAFIDGLVPAAVSGPSAPPALGPAPLDVPGAAVDYVGTTRPDAPTPAGALVEGGCAVARGPRRNDGVIPWALLSMLLVWRRRLGEFWSDSSSAGRRS